MTTIILAITIAALAAYIIRLRWRMKNDVPRMIDDAVLRFAMEQKQQRKEAGRRGWMTRRERESMRSKDAIFRDSGKGGAE